METVPERNNQEPCPRIPTGPAVLAEKQQAHEDVLCGSTGFDMVVLKLDAVRRAVKEGYTSSTYLGGDYLIVSTSTMNDETIADLDWKEELRTVREFRPAIHIPTDYPVYEVDQASVREENIKRLLRGTHWMGNKLSDVSTRVLPLLKGVTPGEREQFYQQFQQMGLGECAFYGTQYFTEGPGFSELNGQLRKIQGEAPDLSVFLIGLLSPQYLEELPSNVVGSAGQAQWRKRIGLRDPTVDLDEMRERSVGLANKAAEALNAGQTSLNSYVSAAETIVPK
jgi:hypothetical protein